MSAFTPKADIVGRRADEAPLDCFFVPVSNSTSAKCETGHVVDVAEVAAELRRIGHELKPFDIVLVSTRAASCIGSDEYLAAGAELDASLRHRSRKN